MKEPVKAEEFNVPEDKKSILLDMGWEDCGYKVLKREIKTTSPLKNIKSLPAQMPIIVPDLAKQELPDISDFLFFDLETTGLSGGAGTVAFLAAFGRLTLDKLCITQYLLMDYPGENDFLENVIAELKTEKSVIVSYNGKSFDSQIIKTRCLMNRMIPPFYLHVDLLHPARRLWKNIIQDCSQASVEARVLGISRTDDIPGSLAPEIWFEFLKTGKTDRLMGICDHNKADIYGLAGILAAVISISENLFCCGKYCYDMERIARSVYVYAYRQMIKGKYQEPLELIKKGLQALLPDTYLYEKFKRRKTRLERVLEQTSS
jgi:hypothetical protein